MLKIFTPIFFLVFLLMSCNQHNRIDKIEARKNEIMQVEKEFAEMAANEGVAKAFIAFAADDAILNRNNSIVEGKAAIKAYFDRQTLTDVKLEWEPDFVDVSESGDLAYTYGKYTFSAFDPNAKKIEAKGIFHTVWKRQADGSWKFVYD